MYQQLSDISKFQIKQVLGKILCTYIRDHSAGSDRVEHHSHTHHALHVMIFPPPQEELHAHVVRTLIDHKAAALHPAGLTPAQVGGYVRAVTHALIRATLEVPVFVESDLRNKISK